MKKTHTGEDSSGSSQAWILVGIDFSQPARQALIQARSITRQREGALLVLHVIDAHGLDEVARLVEVPEKTLLDRLGRERRKRLRALMAEVENGAGEVPTELVIGWGRPFEAILRKASELAVDLIVLGTAGRSADLERALFGSTAEKVLRAAP